MTANAKQLLDDAMTLGRAERADLAASLISSLENGSDPDSEAAWREEVRRRVQGLDDGTSRTVSWEEARTRILAT